MAARRAFLRILLAIAIMGAGAVIGRKFLAPRLSMVPYVER
jgi:hypothetical protein